ncbi:MAG TPA: DUF2569 family protein [Terriglobales bacterium]
MVNQPTSAAVAPAISVSDEAVQTEQPVPPPAAEMSSRPKMIGGWLLLFCVGTILLLPMDLLQEIRESKHLWVQIYDSALLCASLSAGISLVMVSPRAKVFVRIYFLLLLIIVGLIVVRFLNEGRIGHASVMHIFRTTSYVVIWSLYFRSSKRVHETFGENW